MMKLPIIPRTRLAFLQRPRRMRATVRAAEPVENHPDVLNRLVRRRLRSGAIPDECRFGARLPSRVLSQSWTSWSEVVVGHLCATWPRRLGGYDRYYGGTNRAAPWLSRQGRETQPKK